MKSPTQEASEEKAKKLYSLIAGGIALLLFTLYWFATFGYMEDENVKFAEAFAGSFQYFFTNPVCIVDGFTGAAILAYMFILIIIGLIVYEEKMKAASRKHDPNDTVNGDAHLMTLKELKAYNKRYTSPYGSEDSNGPDNVIMSQEMKLGLNNKKTNRNLNMLIIGASGAGKSFFFAAPNILQFNTNLVITDPSGELLDGYGKILEDNGYDVKVFNIKETGKGNKYNPFHYIHEEKDVYTLVETLIKNTTPEGANAGDPFWENAEKLLLQAVIFYLWHTQDEENQTFANVVKLVNLAQIDEEHPDIDTPLDLLFKELEKNDPNNIAITNYKSFKLGAGKTLRSILISVAVRLKAFNLQDIQYLTSKDEFQFENFGDTKQALFVIIPTADKTFNFIVSMMYSQLFATLYDYIEDKIQYAWGVHIGGQFLNVEHAQPIYDGTPETPEKQEKESLIAKKKAEEYLKALKSGFVVKKNNKRKLYEIWTKKGGKDGKGIKVTWRGQKKKLDQVLNEFKTGKFELVRMNGDFKQCPYHVRFILDEFANSVTRSTPKTVGITDKSVA